MSEPKRDLTPEQTRILREKGTEPPFSSKYLDHNEQGIYSCAACGNELFSSEHKFELPSYDPNSGWPSFHNLASNKAVKLLDDDSHGMHRTEVTCAKCGGHLGHLFNDGPTNTKEHYCINSCVLDFNPSKK